jgi:4-hydroxybenzoate polyprenyltransferase
MPFKLARWASFVRFSHTLFALPFALASMLLAARAQRGWPGWRTFLLVLAAMVFARSCAMAFNRIVDRRFDAMNPRTARRHLVTGEISLGSAVAFCGICAVGFGLSAWALNPWCFRLSPVALGVICFYSITKRFTDFTHFWLGLALAIAPVGAWIAVRGDLALTPDTGLMPGLAAWRQGLLAPCVLAVAVILWLFGFDIIYATQDYEFDRRHGLRSVVVRWGPRNALIASFLAHLFMWGVLVLYGLISAFRMAYWIGLVLILFLLVFEHMLARRRNPASVNVAFFKLNAVISCVFVAVVAIEVVFPWFRFRWL